MDKSKAIKIIKDILGDNNNYYINDDFDIEIDKDEIRFSHGGLCNLNKMLELKKRFNAVDINIDSYYSGSDEGSIGIGTYIEYIISQANEVSA